MLTLYVKKASLVSPEPFIEVQLWHTSRKFNRARLFIGPANHRSLDTSLAVEGNQLAS